MQEIRPPAVAGSFYPDEPEALRAQVEALLADNPAPGETAPPKVLIAPHAGYVFSGPLAARAYNLLRPAAERVNRVVLIGPAHRVPVAGLALPEAGAFRTPLGDVPLAGDTVETLAADPDVTAAGIAHAYEHSLEVHLPFLQTVLADFDLVPLVAGDAAPASVARVLETVWGGEETLIVISSDLSHFHPYEVAQTIDRDTGNAILAMREDLTGEQACGSMAINGLMHAARPRGLRITELGMQNSADTVGPRHQVVGYGAYCLQ